LNDDGVGEPGAPGRSLRLDVDLARLADVRAFVRATVIRMGADERAVGDIVLSVDEWVTNVVRHGYRGGHGPLEVDVDEEGSDIVVHVRDGAPVFDPATAPPFDPETPLHLRRPGGMGIHLMYDLMRSVEHRPLPGGGNEVTMRRVSRSAEAGGIA
jgi:serine/threonine-protein kinase RsbW